MRSSVCRPPICMLLHRSAHELIFCMVGWSWLFACSLQFQPPHPSNEGVQLLVKVNTAVDPVLISCHTALYTKRQICGAFCLRCSSCLLAVGSRVLLQSSQTCNLFRAASSGEVPEDCWKPPFLPQLLLEHCSMYRNGEVFLCKLFLHQVGTAKPVCKNPLLAFD